MNTFEETKQQADAVNPIHTNVTPQPIKTPLEVQSGLALLLTRYFFRALFKSATDSAVPRTIHKVTGANALRNVYFNRLEQKLEKRLTDFEKIYNKHFGSPKGKDPSQIIRNIENLKENGVDVGQNFIDEMIDLHSRWDAGTHAENTIQHFLHRGSGKLTGKSQRKIKGAMGEVVFETLFDTSLGLGSFAYTHKMQNNIHTDIMSLYKEAVSYETGKDPRDMQESDISKSDNLIVQDTVKRYNNKRLFRYGISTLPFARWLPITRGAQWGEFAIGAWGALWAFDLLGRQPTMMENFRSFVNDKLNPLYGISDPIKSADIINLYQQYAYRYADDQAFRSISVNDEDANLMWAQSEKVFVRIAQLMNNSYNLKHTNHIDPETNAPVVSADFALPKFIYLLGHGLINARKPEWSMAFIEIANEYGMEDVKKVEKDFKEGKPLADVLKEYPVDLNPNKHVNGMARSLVIPTAEVPIAPQPPEGAKESGSKAANHDHPPKTAVHTDELDESLLKTPEKAVKAG